ncbi:NADPH-dependent 2,4-dienoyl-CoA reductase/sulfur reductase-like enzyme [Isoptericola sp. CG 20/1183]|uniref:NADPH-dependent 2,4-dienoyl-CoA reductase/sulfur reductase-like enzyme n=1 Tax=Isoptericola halotolerans TaxID=300560 RepID=A0ABX5EJQ5_9MICO|nr:MULTISPECIES: FAD-dependent oxidoreductase [Isoptericola]PRZ02873.1 NADPH-dependent 2,4-dienoyl-CoA reductase/sulfur reductase-like enzyme [Isoptericola sp. CG 20/1183]PRZ09870.1 NADPH-dependent 2,4-dienoyl-CoA reductase/sulfur reductase-like enzyme [Isoptericola halotolerans]
MTRDHYDYLLLGGGMASDAAARGIREIDAEGTIGIVGREPTEPVTRPALSKKLWTDPDFSFEQVWTGTAEDTGAELLLGETVVGLDTARRTVRTASGQEIGYGKALVATSGTPASLDVDDPHGSGRVIPFRSVRDYETLRGLTAQGSPHVAVVGGSYIATELAAGLTETDARVTLVFTQDTLLGQMLPADLAQRVESLFREHGVELVRGTEATGGEVRGPDGPVRLTLSSDDELEVDVVVAGLGISLETGFAVEAGLEAVDDGGIVVDAHLRSSDPAVWAAGDVAHYPDPVLGTRRVEHVDHATSSGRSAGRDMAGADEPYTHTPFYYSVLFGVRYEAVGMLDASLEIVEDRQGGAEDPLEQVVAYYVEREADGADTARVHGVLLWGVEEGTGATDAAREVLAAGPVDVGKLPGRIRLD